MTSGFEGVTVKDIKSGTRQVMRWTQPDFVAQDNLGVQRLLLEAHADPVDSYPERCHKIPLNWFKLLLNDPCVFCSYWKRLLLNNKCQIPPWNLLECRNWWSQILVMIWDSTVETAGVPWKGDHFKNITIWPAWSCDLLTLLHVQKNYKVSGTVYFSYLAPVWAGKLHGHATWLTHRGHCRTNPNHPSVDDERFMVTQMALFVDQVTMGILRVC